MNKTLFLLLIAASMIFLTGEVEAQCAMCATQVESARQGGSEAGSALNSGILYLLALPFVALGLITGAFLYHKNKLGN